MENENIVDQIKKILNKIRPYLNAEGGDLEYIDYKELDSDVEEKVKDNKDTVKEEKSEAVKKVRKTRKIKKDDVDKEDK